MGQFLNSAFIGPDNDTYDRLREVDEQIGALVREFLGDEALPLKALEDLPYRTRCELFGGDSFNYQFTLVTIDEKHIGNLFSSGDANRLARHFWSVVCNQLELAPSALVQVAFNSWEWLSSRDISLMALHRNGDDRFDRQVLVDVEGRVYARWQLTDGAR